MFILAMLLFDVPNRNLLLGFVPESVGLLVFGVGLIVLAIGLRWFFQRSEETGEQELMVNQASKVKREN